jgi:hypothetical protein
MVEARLEHPKERGVTTAFFAVKDVPLRSFGLHDTMQDLYITYTVEHGFTESPDLRSRIRWCSFHGSTYYNGTTTIKQFEYSATEILPLPPFFHSHGQYSEYTKSRIRSSILYPIESWPRLVRTKT